MPLFSYTVKDNQGNMHYGTMDAPTTDMVRLSLQDKGFWILSISRKRTKIINSGLFTGRKKVKLDDLIMFAHQLAAMIEAEVPILKSLDILAQQSESKSMFLAIKEASQGVKTGMSLPQALKKHPHIFSDIWVYLLEAGEASGKTPEILRQLASYLELRRSLQEKLFTALLYPSILIVLTIGIIGVFVFKIVPVFSELFENQGMQLPLLTRFVIGTSHFVTETFWLITLFVICVSVGIYFYLRQEKGRAVIGAAILKIPLIGKIVYMILLERFSSNLSLMTKSAVPIIGSIETMEKIFAENLPFQRAIGNVKNQIKQGKTLSHALEKTDIFPVMLVQMISVGEEAGKIPEMLEKAAEYYKTQLELVINRLTVLIEPIIIVFVGSIVAVVVISIFLPIFQMASVGGM